MKFFWFRRTEYQDEAIEDKSDMNAFKDIYEKKESIISAKEQEIILLKNELERIKNNELEFNAQLRIWRERIQMSEAELWFPVPYRYIRIEKS